jgi:hypothetical protein
LVLAVLLGSPLINCVAGFLLLVSRGAEAQLWLSTTEWTTTTQVQRKVEEYLKAIQH